MLEKMKNINERIGQLFESSGGRAEISGNEILMGAVGCKNHYVELLINMHMHTNKKQLKFSLTGLADYLHITVNELKRKIKDSGSNVDELIVRVKRLVNTNTISLSCEQAIYSEFQSEYFDRCKINTKKPLLDQSELLFVVRSAIIALERNITKDVDIYTMLDITQSSWQNKYCHVFNNAVYYIYSELREVANKIHQRLEKT